MVAGQLREVLERVPRIIRVGDRFRMEIEMEWKSIDPWDYEQESK